MRWEQRGHQPGDAVFWWHVPRGGYGHGHNVPAHVVTVTAARVTVLVLPRDRRRWIKRHVHPEALKPRYEPVKEDSFPEVKLNLQRARAGT